MHERRPAARSAPQASLIAADVHDTAFRKAESDWRTVPRITREAMPDVLLQAPTLLRENGPDRPNAAVSADYPS